MNAFPVTFGGLTFVIPSSRILCYFHDEPSFLYKIGDLSKPAPMSFSSDNHSHVNKGLPLSINFSVLALALESFSFAPQAFTSEKLSSQSCVPKQTCVQFGEN